MYYLLCIHNAFSLTRNVQKAVAQRTSAKCPKPTEKHNRLLQLESFIMAVERKKLHILCKP
jgi:hypothetical protein